MAAKKRLGEMLVEAGVLDQAQLQAALAHQRRWGGKLGQAILDLRLASEAQIVSTLAQKLGYETVNVSVLQRSTRLEEALRLVPGEVARRHGLLPVVADAGAITVVMSDPTNVAVADEIAFRTGRKVKIALAGDRAIADAVQRFYYGQPERRFAPPPGEGGAAARARPPGRAAPEAAPGWPGRLPEETVRIDLVRGGTPEPIALRPGASAASTAAPAVARGVAAPSDAEHLPVIELAPLQDPVAEPQSPAPPAPPSAPGPDLSAQQVAVREALQSASRGEDVSAIDARRLAAVLADLLVRKGLVSEAELLEALMRSRD